MRIESADAALAAWTELQRAPCVLEGLVHFEREISVVERVILRYGNGSVTPDGQWVIPLSD